jgi:hypothetical protein
MGWGARIQRLKLDETIGQIDLHDSPKELQQLLGWIQLRVSGQLELLDPKAS